MNLKALGLILGFASLAVAAPASKVVAVKTAQKMTVAKATTATGLIVRPVSMKTVPTKLVAMNSIATPNDMLVSNPYSQPASSAEISPAQKMSTTLKKEDSAKSDRAWSLGLAYMTSSDLNKPESQKTYRHNLAPSFSMKLSDAFGLGVNTGVSWFSEGSNVRNQQDNPSWEDLTVAASWGAKVLPESRLNLSLAESLPTGNESRQEGTRSVVAASAALASSFFDKKVGWTNTVSYVRLFQTYDVSITSGESNPESVVTAGSSLSFRLVKGLAFGANASVSSVHFINGENAARSSTGAFIGYGYSNWRANLGYSIGNYDKNDGYKFLYFDDTKRIASLGVSVEI